MAHSHSQRKRLRRRPLEITEERRKRIELRRLRLAYGPREVVVRGGAAAVTRLLCRLGRHDWYEVERETHGLRDLVEALTRQSVSRVYVLEQACRRRGCEARRPLP